MGTKLNIHDGTRSDLAPRLCDSCSSGVVTKGSSDSNVHIYCMLTEHEVLKPVIECSRYTNSAAPSIWDMRQIAWVLDADAKRQRIGFIRAAEWKRKHEDEELLPSNL